MPTTARSGAGAGAGSGAATTTTTAAPSAAPAALAPAAPGTYRYQTSGQSTLGASVTPYPALTTLVVDPATGTRQRGVRDLREPSGTGPLFEYVLDYRTDGIYLVGLKATITVGLFSQSEELRAPSPVLFLPAGATAGTRREVDVPTSWGGNAHLAIEVQGSESVTVGGRRVDTTRVRLVADLTGQLSARLELTVALAPATRVWAREQFVAQASIPGGGVVFRSEYTATAQSLSPG